MKRLSKRGFAVIVGLVLILSLFDSRFNFKVNAAANANPSWTVDEKLILHSQCNPYDYYAAKDPTIVYYGGKYLVYYTGANQSGGWQMCFTSASTLSGLKTAPRTYMNKIGESYFCAPELFYFEPQQLWYLIYQDGTYGAAYATSTNPADPNSWSGPKSLGISGNMGWDYYIICDDQYAYMYNTPSDGSGKLYMRKTSLSNFPNKGWSAPTVACTNVFEAASVYKSLADNQYYLLVEAMLDGRSYELFTSSSAGGPWKLVNNKWATKSNLTKYLSDKWTTNVSHGELIRAGYNQKLEINDINKVDFLIQGTTDLSGDYQKIHWDLGIIRNYTPDASNVTQVECENMTTGGSYAGKITSPFGGVALYANNDYCSYNQYFAYATHSFSLRGCSSNSGTARVDLQIGGNTVGSFYFTGTTPTVQTLTNVSHGTGNQEIKLVVTTDSGSWDAYVDYLQYK